MMSKIKQYATTQPFAGQRASVARAVLVCLTSGEFIMPGTIVAIDVEKDEPVIQAGDGSSYRGRLEFFDAKTVEDLERMPRGSWCWPPRVV